MSHELFVLRHAKSDWGVAQQADSERALSARGKKNATALGRYMHNKGCNIEQVYCSTAVRARQTLQYVNQDMGIAEQAISYIPQLYLASLATLLSLLTSRHSQGHSDSDALLLVGHNPGLDELVLYLSKTTPPLTDDGKLMTTCALAHFSMPADWTGNLLQKAELVSLIRPADLDSIH